MEKQMQLILIATLIEIVYRYLRLTWKFVIEIKLESESAKDNKSDFGKENLDIMFNLVQCTSIINICMFLAYLHYQYLSYL